MRFSSKSSSCGNNALVSGLNLGDQSFNLKSFDSLLFNNSLLFSNLLLNGGDLVGNRCCLFSGIFSGSSWLNWSTLFILKTSDLGVECVDKSSGRSNSLIENGDLIGVLSSGSLESDLLLLEGLFLLFPLKSQGVILVVESVNNLNLSDNSNYFLHFLFRCSSVGTVLVHPFHQFLQFILFGSYGVLFLSD